MDKTAHPLWSCTGIKSKMEFDDPQWWTAELLARIEQIAGPRRITAAKNYVRSGHVIEMNVSPGLIEAKVQDRRKKPYQVRLYSPTPASDQISMIIHKLAERAIYGALLLSGEMPADIGKIFSDSGADFLPDGFKRSKRLCGCPEQGEDCKHIIAALLVSVDAFDKDPFLMLRNRGIEKDRLISCLTARRESSDRMHDGADSIKTGGFPTARLDVRRPEAVNPAETAESAAPISMDMTFYGTGQLHERLAGIQAGAMEADDLPRDVSALFAFPLWRGEISFEDSINPYYESVRKFLSERY